jgi:hypothetical protein
LHGGCRDWKVHAELRHSQTQEAPPMPNPLLYQINTRITLGELSAATRRQPTFDDIPDARLAELRAAGFEWIWLLGVWEPSAHGLEVARRHVDIRRGLLAELPDLQEEDIVCSPFSVRGYSPQAAWGGASALARLRERAAAQGLRLMLDFVPNHIALDHPWVDEHPEYLVSGTPDDLAREPWNYVALSSRGQTRVFAHGKDPYFPGWTDTLQLDYRLPALRGAMTEQLHRIARSCDGVRCDMAMLVLPDVFERTWGQRRQAADTQDSPGASFWSEAIAAVREVRPGFVFMAEAYWDLEWQLQQQGFDFTYDKRLYDRLRAGAGRAVREHLLADAEYQRRSVRFLENHDEPRAAATFPSEVHRAAALVTYLVPGLRFFHDGQLDGRRSHVAMQARRRAVEAPDAALRAFYTNLLGCLARPELQNGAFTLLENAPAWPGNPTFEDLLAFLWVLGDRRLLVVVNFAPHTTQGYVRLAAPDLSSRRVSFTDLMSPARYDREGDELCRRGLYLDLPAWGHHVFEWRWLG